LISSKRRYEVCQLRSGFHYLVKAVQGFRLNLNVYINGSAIVCHIAFSLLSRLWFIDGFGRIPLKGGENVNDDDLRTFVDSVLQKIKSNENAGEKPQETVDQIKRMLKNTLSEIERRKRT